MATVYKTGASGSAVKEIQRMLNKNLKPSPNLDEDGKFGPGTAEAVKAFQKKNRLKADGIVGSDTLAVLEGTAAPKPGVAAVPPDAHTSRGSFVDSKVKENAVASKILDRIWRYFPKKYRVISAYLSTSDLYWKVNYHWTRCACGSSTPRTTPR